MKNKKFLIFDLDGTVADSAPGVIAAAKYSMEKMGVAVPNGSTMARFLGPPLSYSFSVYAGVADEKLDEAIELYREYYREKGIYMCTLFPGAADFFAKAAAAGKRLLIASSKPLPFVKEVLHYLGIEAYFTCVSAPDFASNAVGKAGIIAAAIKSAAAKSENCIMIGDRHYDVEGAAENGLPCVGIVNGSVFKEELQSCGAVYVAEDFRELGNYLL